MIGWGGCGGCDGRVQGRCEGIEVLSLSKDAAHTDQWMDGGGCLEVYMEIRMIINQLIDS